MSRALRIAIASGKGGTGKTTIATNLAAVLAQKGRHAAYVDCDVEEPNGHLFLKPVIDTTRDVSIPVPEIDSSRCLLCGACARACRFSALVALPNKLLTFPKLCHGCGACTLACPTGAIREVPRRIGVVEEGAAGRLSFLQGRLDVGEAMAPPVIRAVLQAAPDQGTVIIDSPPGTACPVVSSLKTADVALLVTEPTPFGLHDLKLVVEVVRELGIPFGAAVNRVGTGDNGVFEYCAREGIVVPFALANDHEIARAASCGVLATNALPSLRHAFASLHDGLCELADGPRPRKARTAPQHVPAATPPPSSDLVSFGRKTDARELVVISGKGGTGKTSVVASFLALADRAAAADCDVDASDLHLILTPKVERSGVFLGGMLATIDRDRCTGCARCAEACRFEALRSIQRGTHCSYEVDPTSCEGCGVCVDVCPSEAASLSQAVSGEWYLSETRFGPMAHARLGIAQENSGKLVALVRKEGQSLARSTQQSLMICDGSPGIGCPVISSLTGASMVLVVTEPTLSGLHDLERVAALCAQLGVKAGVCINKADINPALALEMEEKAVRWQLEVLGRIRYDEAVIHAQINQLSVVEYGPGAAAEDIRALWERVKDSMGGSGSHPQQQQQQQ